jgi:hypothetical protein
MFSILHQKSLTRRSFIASLVKGSILASIPLPILETMLHSHGEVLADGLPLPTRFGIWFWGNGIRREHWIPDQQGYDWVPKAELMPLNDLKPYFNLITNLEVKTATHPHHSGMAGILSGAPFQKVADVRDTIVSTFREKSLDQVVADAYAAQGLSAPFRSLELGVARFRGTDEGTTFQYLSHNGPNNVNPSEYNGAVIFNRLFGIQGEGNAYLQASKKSVLDHSLAQVEKLKQRVSQSDRIRLDQHLESIRALEQRLSAVVPTCARPDQNFGLNDIDPEPLAEKNEIMAELARLAFSCDLTRVLSVMFSTAGSGVVVWPAGASNSLHQMCHDEAVPQPLVHQSIVYIMERLGVFLRKLRDTPEGNGNLLDRSVVLCTTELSEGNRHTNDEYPIILAGKGNGRLITGQHIRMGDRDNASRALLTALRGAGLSIDSFGYDNGWTNQRISQIENG